MSLLLWTNTSEKPQIKRRFSLTYPQAVPVVIGKEKAPQPLLQSGVQTVR